MRDAYPSIRTRGAELVVIGNGTPAMAQDFRDERDVPFPLFVDPSRRTYQTAGFKRGLFTVMTPRVLKNTRRAAKKGFRQGRVLGDAWQQGGLLVVDTGGEVRMHFISKAAGDHPDLSEILAALPVS